MFQLLPRKVRHELEIMADQIIVWASRLSDVEKLLGLCLAILVLFMLIVRPSNKRKRDRSESIQFIFAMTLVIGAGLSVGWFFDPGFLQ